MRTTDWYISLGMIILSYLAFAFFSDYRIVFLIIFSFSFSLIVSRDEWRLGRIISHSIIPLFLSVALLFIAAYLGSSFDGDSPLQSGQASVAAIGCIVLLSLCLLLGVPLAWAGARVRNYFLPSPSR